MGFLEKSQVAEGISWVCELGFDSSSSCIQRIVTDGFNLLFLFVFILVLLVGSLAKRSVDADRAKDRGFLIVSILCVVLGFAYLGYGILAFLSRNNEFNHWIWLKYLVRVLVWMGLSVSLRFLKIKSVRILSLVWWVSFSVLISVVNVNILVQTQALPVLDIVAWPVNLLLLFCSVKLLRTVISQRTQNQSLSKPLLIENGNKEVTSTGFFSSLTFSWINPLLSLGYLKPLVLQDVPALEPKDDALLAYQAFLLAWETQRKENPEAKNIVLRALANCYLKEMILVGLGAFLRSVSVLVSPLLLYGFVKFSERKEQNLQGGLLLVAGLVLAKIVESLSQRQWFFNSRRIGMRMRSALMVAIFQKQLKLSSLGRKNHSTGEIVNYVAVDAHRFGEFPWWFHSAWSYVMQLIFSICILFGTVGWGALPGLVPIFLCALLNVPFAKMLQNCQSKFMNAQDERLRATSEILNSMKIIKLQSWEENFKNLIETLRAIEFKWLASIQINKSYGAVLYWMSPIFISAVIFAGCAILRTAPLVPTTIFTVLATLRIMAEPVRMIPEALSFLIQVKVSLDRIDSFLLADELKEDVKKITSVVSDHGVRIHGGVFSWDPDGASATLKNIDLQIRKREKIAVCGPVGAGKSSLLYAVLGEIPKLSGSVEVSGSIAYVSQTAWIQSGTIRENILYGKPMIKTHYERAIKSCALDKDLESFNYGDLTEIGQRGLNMSGGQKQRIQLARAVYNDADIYLLDDPFSAVDAHTASILFNHCVMEALEGKTVILVTHQVEFLAEVDRILVLEGGKITQLGSYEELLKDGTAFEQLVNAHRDAATVLGPSIKGVPSIDPRPAEDHPPEPTKSNSDLEISVNGVLPVQLTEDEEKETGDYGWKPFIDYIHLSRGSLLLFLIILSQSSFVIFQMVSSYWLAIGVQIPQISSGVLVGAYTGLSIFTVTFAFLRSWLTAHLGLKASNAFFSGFMNSIFKAPMLFFDSTPVGRILTRASSDMSILDFDIPYSITFTLVPAIEILATLIVMSTVTWQVLIVAIPVMLITGYVQGYYLASARELVRINGTTKAPIMNYAAETSLGVITVRAFATMERFIDRNLELVDIDARLFFHTNAALEWLLLRIEALQNITLFTSTLFLVLLPPGAVTSGFAGLSLSYALALTSTQVFMSRWYCCLANHIISIERIKQYMNLPSEPPAIIDDKRPPPSWPIKGRIDFQDLRIRYRPNAPMILKGIACTFEQGSRVGVVGRTGSGKTTLISALFRLVDPTSGRILIDGIDICSIGLKDLRMKLSVIPQEPTLFKGSIRSNLDPLGLYSDHEIWEAIEKCQLLTAIRDLPNQLDSSVSDEGENWSAGQRQLFCLGRVLLRRNKILVLDEATASIDSATDVVLQRVIREEFSSCTVITVAHRVPTVIDSDMVLVLSYGKLVEYDNPSKLMETNSSFAKLVAEYWSNCSKNSMQNLRLSMDKEVLK